MPIFEQRMIYRVGKSSLAITLPQNWLKYYGLTAGDSVEVTGNGDLVIHPTKKLENRGEVISPEGINNGVHGV